MIILKYLIPCLILSIGTGGLAAIIISGNIYYYDMLDKPPLAPMPMLFPIVWTVLYILMGIAHYVVHISTSAERQNSVKLYYTQLVFNFLWPILFFKFKMLFLSVICILVLLIFVLKTVKSFYKISHTAGNLMIPYTVWLIFATYLNIGVWILN